MPTDNDSPREITLTHLPNILWESAKEHSIVFSICLASVLCMAFALMPMVMLALMVFSAIAGCIWFVIFMIKDARS